MKSKKLYKTIIAIMAALQLLFVNVVFGDILDGLDENPNINIILLAILSVLIIIMMLYVRKIGLDKQRLQEEAEEQAKKEAEEQAMKEAEEQALLEQETEVEQDVEIEDKHNGKD
jgi:Tfp pilus assembly protein PilO